MAGMAARRGANVPDEQPCSKCKRLLPPYATRCDTCGAIQAGNTLAVKSGVFSRVAPAHLRQSADEMLAGLIADLGGEENLTTLQRGYCHKLRDLEIIARGLASDLANRGLVTAGGKSRSSLDRYLAVLRCWDGLAQRLGLERRARDVGLTLDAYKAFHERGQGEQS
jgi:hypothetical protein